MTTTSAAISACTGNQLSGTFKEAPGGGGAGQIEYILTLTNTSQAACRLSGEPNVTLLDVNGTALPTRSAGAVAISVPLTLQPESSATATARFSPDVPGPGDSQTGACQPKAYTLRITANGGGTLNAPIKPPTSVCERGTLGWSSYYTPA